MLTYIYKLCKLPSYQNIITVTVWFYFQFQCVSACSRQGQTFPLVHVFGAKLLIFYNPWRIPLFPKKLIAQSHVLRRLRGLAYIVNQTRLISCFIKSTLNGYMWGRSGFAYHFGQTPRNSRNTRVYRIHILSHKSLEVEFPKRRSSQKIYQRVEIFWNCKSEKMFQTFLKA